MNISINFMCCENPLTANLFRCEVNDANWKQKGTSLELKATSECENSPTEYVLGAYCSYCKVSHQFDVTIFHSANKVPEKLLSKLENIS